MESKKINQLATAVSPSTSDLAIIGDPVTGVSKKITWLQVSTLIGTAANLQQVTDNGATTTNAINIGGLTITGLSTGVLKSDSGVISSVPFGAANGVATLAGDGKVPSSQLPSYVDDVVEVANYAALPVTGETGKIYITLDNNKVYRWGGSVYVEIAANNAIWGSITGTLANQTDLQNALDAKANDSAVVHLAGTETITGTKTFSNPSKNDGGILLKNGASYSLSGYMNLGGMTDGLRFTSGGGISNFFTLPSSVGYTYTFPALSGTIVAISGGNSTQYIDGTGSLQTFPTLISSDKLVKLVRNQSGATMTAGTIVYISGATGNKPLITKALATGDSTSAQTYGLVQADIANNADGYVVVIGNITDIDTSALTEGQQLYLSGTTAGAYTTTKPYAPIHLVYIGIVLRSHPTQGIIGVKIQNGYEMDELHNVDAQSPSNNDILSYNTSTSLWEHKQIATTLGFTPISLASLSATSPLSYNNTTGAFSIQVATASQNGYLSSTDWSTFNNKQAALGGTGFVKISGSTISYDNSTYYLASNPSAFITLASLSAGAGISYSNITGVISSTITQYTDALARAAISSSATGLTYTSSTGVFSLTAGYAIPTTAKQTEWDTAYTNRITSLTTTGTSGVATLVANTLNIPNYTYTLPTASTSVLGGVKVDGTTITINGSGVISGANTYSLPIATASVLGGVKIGSGVSVDVNGVISVSTSYQAPLNGTGFVKASGTTITYDNSTYVTTNTTQTISGTKTFSASPIIDSGLATAIPLRFKQYDSASFNSDGYTDLYVMNAYRFGFAFNQGSSNYKGFTFNVNGITLNTSREYTMPNAAGTLALTSDIPSLTGYVPYTGATGSVALGSNTLQVNEKIGTADNKGFYLRGISDSTHKIYFNTTGNNNIWEYNNSILYQWYNTGSPVTRFTFATNGDFTAVGALSASNFNGTSSGTNTGDQTLSGLGGVPTSRTLTINGTAYDLSANRSWTITAGVTGSGTATRVAFWDTTGSITSSSGFYWDNVNGRLAVGRNSADARLEVYGSTKGQIRANGGLSMGGGIDIYTELTGADRRNWGLHTESTDAGDFEILRSASAGVAPTIRTLSIAKSGEGTIWNHFNVRNGLSSGIGIYLDNTDRAGGTGRNWSILSGNTGAGELNIKDETSALNRFKIGGDGVITTYVSALIGISTDAAAYMRISENQIWRTGGGALYINNSGTGQVIIAGGGGAITLGIDTQQGSNVITTKNAGITGYNTYFGTGQIRIGGGSDHTTNTVLSVAPGVVQFDRPGIAGGAFKINSDGYGIFGLRLGVRVTPEQPMHIDQVVTAVNQGIPATSGTTQKGILRLTPATGLYGETLDFGMNVGPSYGWIQATNTSNLAVNYNLALNPNGGYVYIGTSSAVQSSEQFAVVGSGSTAIFGKNTGGNAVWVQKLWNNSTTGDTNILEFLTETTLTARGSVKYDRTNDALLLSGSNALNIATNGTTFAYFNAQQRLGVGTTPTSLRFTAGEAGSIISGGAVTFATQAKGIEIYNTNGGGVTDNLIGLWFSTGPHKSGIASGRTNAASTWEVDLRFFVHDTNLSNLDNTYERMRLSGGGTLTCSGDVIAYGSPSDIRLKTIKEKVPNALESVLKLNGYRFDWKKTDHLKNYKEDIGVIAQEVEALFPELARTNDDGYMSVRYQGLTAVLIEAIKEQQKQIDDLKKQIA